MIENINKLPLWINKHMPKFEGVDFIAKAVDTSFNGRTTLTVEIKEDGNDVGLYKCNIDILNNKWLAFYLLVVVWNTEYKPKASMGSTIIDHFTKSVKDFCDKEMPSFKNRFFTSGNLTVQKGGKSFFSKINWDIIEPSRIETKELYKDNDLLNAFTYIEQSISSAIPASSLILDTEDSNISFSFLEF